MALTTKNAGSLVHSAAGKEKGIAVKIEILRDTVAGGLPVFTGERLEVTDTEARLLINLGKAQEVRLLPEVKAAETKEPGNPYIAKDPKTKKAKK